MPSRRGPGGQAFGVTYFFPASVVGSGLRLYGRPVEGAIGLAAGTHGVPVVRLDFLTNFYESCCGGGDRPGRERRPSQGTTQHSQDPP